MGLDAAYSFFSHQKNIFVDKYRYCADRHAKTTRSQDSDEIDPRREFSEYDRERGNTDDKACKTHDSELDKHLGINAAARQPKNV